MMQIPVFLILFFAPVYVPLALLQGWIHGVAVVNPMTPHPRDGPQLRRRRAVRGRPRRSSSPSRSARCSSSGRFAAFAKPKQPDSLSAVAGTRAQRGRARPPGGARRGAVARDRPRLRPADGARSAAVPDRAAAGRADRARRGASGRPSTTRRCSINVGCHTDAHEQAKWFGDDIAVEVDQVRPRVSGASARPRRRSG